MKASHWTEPYIFFVTKDLGITASISLARPEAPEVNTIVALDILLMDITRYTIDAKPTPNGKVLVLDKDGRLVGPAPRASLANTERLDSLFPKPALPNPAYPL